VDLLDRVGATVGATPWFSRAVEKAKRYPLREGRDALGITPPYFLATKLAALQDTHRNPDFRVSQDVEDIVTLVVEVESLLEMIQQEGLAPEISQEWARVFAVHNVDSRDFVEIADYTLHARDSQHRSRVVRTLNLLAEAV
jgi:hypothetical protein